MAWIDECLRSVIDQSQVIIVDNNSTDTTLTFIKENYPTAVIFENDINLGFGRANNIGMKYALEKGADFVFLLNQDAYLQENSIKELVSVSKKYPEYGILSPVHLSINKGLDFKFEKYLKVNTNYFEDLNTNKPLQPIYEYNFLNAAAWLIPKKVLLNVGGFDPIFFHYGEDENYCQRVKYHNLKIGLVPKVSVIHDRTQYPKKKPAMFSEKYFKNFEKHIKVAYANINNKEEINFMVRFKYKYLKKALKHFLFINLSYTKGFLRQHSMLKKIYEDILKSKDLNKKIGNHYL